jgi:hypothetical protein
MNKEDEVGENYILAKFLILQTNGYNQVISNRD